MEGEERNKPPACLVWRVLDAGDVANGEKEFSRVLTDSRRGSTLLSFLVLFTLGRLQLGDEVGPRGDRSTRFW